MEIYIYILIIMVIVNLLKLKPDSKKKISRCIFIILVIVSAIRQNTVGKDTLQFWNFFRQIEIYNESIFSIRTEIGFNLLCKILTYITSEPQILLIATSIFINCMVYRFIEKNSKDTLFSTLLYFTLNHYFSSMNLMRQWIAIAFILLGYEYLKDNKYFKYSFFVLIACLFHMSAVLMFILIPIKKYNKNKNIIMVTITVSILAFILTPVLFNIVVNFSDYEKYLESDYIGSSYISAGMYTLTNFLFFIFGFIIPNKEKLKEKFDLDSIHKMNSWIIAIATIISVMSIRITIFNRLFLYFNFFNIIWIPNSLEILESKINKDRYKIIIIIFTIFYVMTITSMGWTGIYPYLTFWQK